MPVIHPHSSQEYSAIKATPNTLVIVDFSATWCGPCKKIAPRFEAISNQFPNVKFVHVDVDKLRDHADVQNVKGVPTFKFFKNGQLLEQFSAQSFPLTLKECDQNWDRCFDIYVKIFDKIYLNEQEYEYRFNVFLDSLDRINNNNKMSKGHVTFGINEFSDMTPQEFAKTKLTNMPRNLSNNTKNVVQFQSSSETIPTSFDWRNSSTPVITPVNNQLQCGSCWAESATETVESYWALAGNPLIQLSVQQSVDCCSQAYGCMGGWPSWAYESLITEGGVESAQEYPYEGINERCRFNRSDIVATITNWASVTNTKNETLMTEWVALNGPLSVCVDASSWMDYTTGIIWHGCGNWINHCVQIVGYGVSRRGIPYWTVRNSWGTNWGEEGYLKVYRGNDTCAIAQVVTTVIV